MSYFYKKEFVTKLIIGIHLYLLAMQVPIGGDMVYYVYLLDKINDKYLHTDTSLDQNKIFSLFLYTYYI